MSLIELLCKKHPVLKQSFSVEDLPAEADVQYHRLTIDKNEFVVSSEFMSARFLMKQASAKSNKILLMSSSTLVHQPKQKRVTGLLQGKRKSLHALSAPISSKQPRTSHQLQARAIDASARIAFLSRTFCVSKEPVVSSLVPAELLHLITQQIEDKQKELDVAQRVYNDHTVLERDTKLFREAARDALLELTAHYKHKGGEKLSVGDVMNGFGIPKEMLGFDADEDDFVDASVMKV